VSAIEIPYGNATADPNGQYKGLYNPGGPGNNPTPGESVLQALIDRS
jgi:hypothetical protein